MLEPRAIDPLFVVNPRRNCKVCNNRRRHRRRCDACQRSGYEPADLEGLWAPAPGFLVCGGPSLMTMPIQRLAERGIVSLAVNNAGGYAPVKAWCFGDPQWKFHHGLFLDPAMLTFAPSGKLARCVRVKIDGEFCGTDIQLRHCPNTYGFARSGRFEPGDFLTDPAAHWGKSGRNDKEKGDRRRITTMLCGIRLLHYLGCRRIYMLGVDFKAADDGHRYAWEKRGGSGWRKMGLMLEELAPEFEKTGFDVYQCNPESECKVFPYVPFETALEDCRGAVPAEPFDLVEWYARRPFEESKKKPLMKYAEVLAKSCG